MPVTLHIAHLALTHLVSIASFVLAIVLVSRAEAQRRATGSTVAWVLAVLLIPYLGIPLYLLFGSRKLAPRTAGKDKLLPQPHERRAQASMAPTARMLCSSGASPPTTGNRVELLPTGELSFAAVVDEIERATRSIDVSTLILAHDEVGDAIATRLAEKARSGVRVRVLIDALFEFRSSRRQIQELLHAGVKVAWFMPLGRLSRRGNANLRLHRKAIVVDERVAIVGGMNLAREYMGPTPMPGRWRDLSAKIFGPSVTDVASIFAADWSFASSDAPASVLSNESSASDAAANGVTIQVVGSGPDAESDRIYDAVLTSVFAAKRRLWIATPYFVPDEALVRAIELAVRRGVDVCIVVPLASNHLTADLAGAAYLRNLDRVGARVRCYEPGMMHAKLVLVDDAMGILGSANMDMRSFFLDYELALFIESAPEIEAMATWLEGLFPSCVDLPRRGRVRRFVESATRLLAPFE